MHRMPPPHATASLAPIPGDAGRFAYFDVLGDGPAWLTVLRDGVPILHWVGGSVTGVGLVMD